MPSRLAGSSNPNWKGGRTITTHGYVLIRQPSHPSADVRGYVYEHRLVAEQMLGRPLSAHEHVHHRDGNKSNNDPRNLEVMPSRRHHAQRHRTSRRDLRNPDESNPTVSCSCGCGVMFLKFDDDGRPRRYVSGHNMREGKRHAR